MGAEQSHRSSHNQASGLRSHKSKLHSSWRSASMKCEVNRNGTFGKQTQDSHKVATKRHSFSSFTALQQRKDCVDSVPSKHEEETISVVSEFELLENEEDTKHDTKIDDVPVCKETKPCNEAWLKVEQDAVNSDRLRLSHSHSEHDNLSGKPGRVAVVPLNDNDSSTTKKKSTLKRAKSMSDAAQLNKSRAEFVNRSKQFTMMLKQYKQRDSFRDRDNMMHRSSRSDSGSSVDISVPSRTTPSVTKRRNNYMDDWLRSQQDRITNLVAAANRNSALCNTDARGEDQTANINQQIESLPVINCTVADGPTPARKSPVERAEEFLSTEKYLGTAAFRQLTSDGLSPVEALKQQYKMRRKSANCLEIRSEMERPAAVSRDCNNLATGDKSAAHVTSLRRSHTYHAGGSKITPVGVTDLDVAMGCATQTGRVIATGSRSPLLKRQEAIVNPGDSYYERPSSVELSDPVLGGTPSSHGSCEYSPESIAMDRWSSMEEETDGIYGSDHDLRVRNINNSLLSVMKDLRTIREQDVRLARQLIHLGKSIKQFKSQQQEDIEHCEISEEDEIILSEAEEAAKHRIDSEQYYVTKVEFDGRSLAHVSEESLDSIDGKSSDMTFSSHW